MPDEESVAKDLDRKKRLQIIANAYHRLFNSDDGKIVLADMEKKFGLKASVFFPVKTGENVMAYDPLTAAVTDGARRVIIHIHEILSMPMQGDGDIQPTKKPKVKR